MPAVSKKQQRFFGIVRAIQKGEMAPTTPETAKAAADMKKSDVKDFASTKHKGLPEKKVKKEESKLNEYYGMPGGMGSSASKKLRADYDDEEYLKRKSKKDRLLAAVRRGREKRKKMKEESNLQERGDFWHPDPEKDRKLGGPGANQRAREDRPGSSKPKSDPKKLRHGESYMQYAKRMRNEETKYDRYDKQDKENKKRDDRMKFGKFYTKAKEARDRLRPGEVKKWDPEKKRYVSNKE